MKIRSVCLAAALSLVCGHSSMAGIVGSTYDATLATSNSDLTITAGGTGYYTDLVGPLTFCVSATAGSGCGFFGDVFFTDVDATVADITFEFSGTISAAAGDSFTVDLGNFVTLDGSRISSIDPKSVSLGDGVFQLTSFDGSDAIFTGIVGPDGLLTAGAGQTVVFEDDFVPAPEPASFLLAGFGLAAVAIAAKRPAYKGAGLGTIIAVTAGQISHGRFVNLQDTSTVPFARSRIGIEATRAVCRDIRGLAPGGPAKCQLCCHNGRSSPVSTRQDLYSLSSF